MFGGGADSKNRILEIENKKCGLNILNPHFLLVGISSYQITQIPHSSFFVLHCT